MTAPEEASVSHLLAALFLGAAALLYHLLIAVVLVHAWTRWAVPLGAPEVPLIAVVVTLMLRVALHLRTPPAGPLNLWATAGLVVFEYLWLGATAAVVWGAP